MKKIFRMALVFALAGATLMYTGCTKDYGEEIDNLDSKLTNVQKDLSDKLSDLQGQLSTVKSSVSSLESAVAALKSADEGFKTDISGLKTKVAAIEDAIKDLDKLATKKELSDAQAALEKKIDDDLAALKAEALAKAAELNEQIELIKAALDLKADKESVYTKEEIDAKLAEYYTQEEAAALIESLYTKEEVDQKLEEAQQYVDDAIAILSDELRSIVFYPDFYFAGIEATAFDFASFVGYEILSVSPWGDMAIDNTIYKIKAGAKYKAENLVYKENGKVIKYKWDEKNGYAKDKDGNYIVDYNNGIALPLGVYTQGQIGKANYNLNPSSFDVEDAEWSLNGDDKKYVVKGADSWQPVFESISKDENGLATVKYSVENPEEVFSSILNAIPYLYNFGVINPETESAVSSVDVNVDLVWYFNYLLGAYAETEVEEVQGLVSWEKLQAAIAAYDKKKKDDSNVPIMQLQADLEDGRSIFSDWHAVMSSEELVAHLAFADKNNYKTLVDCGYKKANKDLYLTAAAAIVEDLEQNENAFKVKYNGGPVDLSKEIAIHTTDGGKTIASYTLAQFTEKYPGYHFEFELVPYTIGNNATSEDMYGQIDGTNFTPCLVTSAGGQASKTPIEKGSEAGISSVGRMPVILVTLVGEDGFVHAYGWFKVLISKDAKAPEFYEIPDLGKVPYICSNYALRTAWHEFSYFVLETLGVDYQQFINNYKFDGVWVKANVLSGKTVKNELVKTGVTTEGSLQNVTFQNYNTSKKAYETLNWGTASYIKDQAGSGINDGFTWNVSPTEIGEGNVRSIYFKFVNGDAIVYFEMKADVAAKAKMTFASNKINNLWFADINGEAMNTVRISVPVPTADQTIPGTTLAGGDVKLFQKDLYEFFIGNKPALALDEDNDPIYGAIYRNQWSPYRAELLATTSKFQFSTSQPEIATPNLGHNTQLFVKDWIDYGVEGDAEDYTKLYAVAYAQNMFGAYEPVMQEVKLKNGDTTKKYAIYESQLVATIFPAETGGYVIKYADTAIAKYILNLWSYKKTDQAEMLYANVTALNAYGSTACAKTADGNFHVRFIRPIDVDFAAQDVAEESQIDGANVEVIKFFDGITDWNNQKVIDKVMVDKLDADGKVVKDANGDPVKVWNGQFAEHVIKTVNMYKYYGFTQVRIDVASALRNNWDPSDPAKWGYMARETPAHTIKLGTVRADGTFQENASLATVDITDFNNLAPIVVNYRNTQGYAEAFQILIPVQIDYAWGTLSDYMVINIKETSETQGR